MSQPERDDGTINASLEQSECHGVAKQVDCDSFSFERGADAGGVRRVLGEHVLDAVDTQPPAFHVRKEQSSIAARWLTEPGLSTPQPWLCQRGAAFFSALSDHANVGTVPRSKSSRVAAVISDSVDPFARRSE